MGGVMALPRQPVAEGQFTGGFCPMWGKFLARRKILDATDRIGNPKQIFGASSQLAALAGSFRLAYASAELPNEDADLAMRVA